MRIGLALALILALACAPALGCEAPDDLDGTPWRIAVAKVKYLPETEAWAKLMERERTVVQYVVMLDAPRHLDGRCYWPVEIRAEGRLWKRFLVTPDGRSALEDRRR
jgi:hypothetical protein